MSTVVAVHAGLGQPSATAMLAEQLARAAAAASDGAEVVVVSLRDHAKDLVNHLLTHVASPSLQAALDAVAAADALVVVSPVFNASYSGLFKMFFDVLAEGALRGTPTLLAATGGTPRHSLVIDQAMLPLFHYLKASVVPMSVYAATDDWGSTDTSLTRRIEAAGRALAEHLVVPTGDATLPDVPTDDAARTDAPAPATPGGLVVEDFTTLLARGRGH